VRLLARLAASIVVLLCAALAAEAQPAAKVYRIGVLEAYRSPSLDLFVQGLREFGYFEGRNILIEYRSAEGRLDRLPALAEDLASIKVDVILAWATGPALAAKNATKTIPIVFMNANDPVNAGLVASLARPGGNVTGWTNTGPDLSGKRLELLKELLPAVSRVAVLWNAGNPLVARQVSETEVAAHALKTELRVVAVRAPDDLESAFSTIVRGRAGGLIVIADVFTTEHRERIAALAAKNRLPMISEFRVSAVAGGLMAYGPSAPDAARRAAAYVDRILKGAKPGELPVEQPTKFDFVINLKTARALGLTIPRSMLLRADQVLE
jgi:putative ABC transport system substrate-binding protein